MSQHLEAKKNNAHQLWALMTFELWYDLYIEQEEKQ